MKRNEFLDRAKKHGHDPKNKKKMDPIGRNRFKQELIDYFTSPAGQEAIAKAPTWHRDKSPEELAELLMQEVD